MMKYNIGVDRFSPETVLTRKHFDEYFDRPFGEMYSYFQFLQICGSDWKELKRRYFHGGFDDEMRNELSMRVTHEILLKWAIEDLTQAVEVLTDLMRNR